MTHSVRGLGVARRALFVLMSVSLSSTAWGAQALRQDVDRFVRSGQSVDLAELLKWSAAGPEILREVSITYSMVRSELVAEWLRDGEVVCRTELAQGIRQEARCRLDAPVGAKVELRLAGQSGQVQLLEVRGLVDRAAAGQEVGQPPVGERRSADLALQPGRRTELEPLMVEPQELMPRDTQTIQIPRRARRVWLPLSAGDSERAFSRGGPVRVYGALPSTDPSVGRTTRHYLHLDIPVSGLPKGATIARVVLYVRLGPGSDFSARLSRWEPVEQDAEVLGTVEDVRPFGDARDPAPRAYTVPGSSNLEFDPSRLVYTLDVSLQALGRPGQDGRGPSIGVIELRGVAVEYE